MRKLTKNIIMFSTADWSNPFWTNKQHTAQQLADRGYKVLYIESLGLRAPTIQRRDLKRIVKRLMKFFKGTKKVHRNIRVYSPLVIPFHRFRLVKIINAVLLRTSLIIVKYRLGMRHCSVWTYNPMVLPLTKYLRHRYLVYHCVDDLSAAPGIPKKTIKESESSMVESSDVVFATSRRLEEICKSYTEQKDKVHYYSNVADYDHFHKSTVTETIPDDISHIPHPRIGFVGAISEYKLDFSLISNLAEKYPDHHWILIGQIGEGQPKTKIGLLDRDNIHIIGPRSYHELPLYLTGFDVVTLPCPINEYTSSMFPMKFFEYLAANKKLVTTALPSIEEYTDSFFWTQSSDEFEMCLLKALNEDCCDQLKIADRIAQEHTWDKRLDKMLECSSRSYRVEKKCVLMITSRADIGGGSKHLLDLLSSLKNNPSYDLFVASPREGEFAVSYLDICGEESFCPIPFRSFSLKSLFRLILFIKKNEIDIIHSHGHGAGSFSRLAKIFIPRVKVVHSFHGVHKRKGVVSMFYDLFEKLMKSTVSRFVCVSNDEFERAKKFGFVTKKAVVVNNGVAIPQKIENLNSKRIVSVTRFDPIKGIDLLAQTFNHCELPDEWSIEVAGDGELFDQITTENKDSKIDFKGAIYPIDSFYDEASIYISFSRGEGLPISVIEAMSRGIPCLISNVSGHYTFTIAPDKTGVIGFDLDDNEDFCKKLRSLMDNPEFRRTKGQNARKFAEENFSLSGMVSEMEKVYNSI